MLPYLFSNHLIRQFCFFLCSLLLCFHAAASSSVAACSAAQPPVAGADGKVASSVYDFTANDIDGKPVQLGQYRGKVLIIVNVASNCGYTDGHYKEFNQLYKEYEAKGKRTDAPKCMQLPQLYSFLSNRNALNHGQSTAMDPCTSCSGRYNQPSGKSGHFSFPILSVVCGLCTTSGTRISHVVCVCECVVKRE